MKPMMALGCTCTVIAAISCSENNLLNFNSSDCKSYSSEVQELKAGLYTAGRGLETDLSLYRGLSCVSWDASGSNIKIDLINILGACSVKYTGSAKTESGNGLELFSKHEVDQTGGCGSAACVGCLYDFSYEVNGVSTDSDCPLTLTVGEPCDQSVVHHATLPLASEKSGIMCNYYNYGTTNDYLGYGSADLMCCNLTNYPLGVSGNGELCKEGLSCTEVTSGNKICLKNCQVDSDCPADGVHACVDGLCRLTNVW